MTVAPTTLLFFDASCLMAAAGSAQGGSGFLLALCQMGRLRAAVSHVVLLETERNLAAKRPAALSRYHELLAQIAWVLAPVPAALDRMAWAAAVNPKDRHVVAAALACNAVYLLTLDRGLRAELGQAALPLIALEPGTFIKTVLPLYGDLETLP